MSNVAPSANWAGNITFGPEDHRRPATVEALQEVVAQSAADGKRVRAVGAAHSFNRIADVDGVLVSTDDLCRIVELDATARTVTVEGGIRYAALTAHLHDNGWALANLPSLPHVSVAGAVATGTHGSGDGNRVLAAAVASLDLVTASGEVLHLDREDAEFAAALVGLGSFGVVARATLTVEPTYDVRQWVSVDAPFSGCLEHLDEILASAYSVSLFTDWTGGTFHQIWRKQRADESNRPVAGLDLAPAEGNVHPIRGISADACTAQLGVAGPWHQRLCHFRADSIPSAGAELQSEYFVARSDASAALQALGQLSDTLAPLVLASEVRSVAADRLWLSPAYEQASVAVHFTWRPRPSDVATVLPLVEDALAPFAPRPHWAKLTALDGARVRARYPRFADWMAARDRLDPAGVFRNRYLEQLLA
jgi:xylitol oxidase